jgi:tRNA1Val (adenine37-N6)-methyltransferase
MHTEDALFDGRLLLRQPQKGYRFSADAPLLVWFACTSSERSFRCAADLGTGCGVVALGLLAAKKADRVVAVEIQERLFACCAENAARNGLGERLEAIRGDMRDAPALKGRRFDLVAINPPFWRTDHGHLPDDDERRIACHEVCVDLGGWVGAAARLVEPRKGRLCAVFPARRAAELLAAFAGHGLGATRLLAVHPRPDERAELVLVEARSGAGRPLAVEPPLFLRDRGNSETAEARAIFAGEFSEAIRSRADRRVS